MNPPAGVVAEATVIAVPAARSPNKPVAIFTECKIPPSPDPSGPDPSPPKSVSLPEIVDKRQGFIELGGRLIVQTTRDDVLDIIDNRMTMIPSLIRIETDNQIIEISQKKILYKSSQKNSDTFTKELPFCKPLQSEISHLMVQEILQTGNSGLTSIDESYILHKPLIEAFNEHLSDINGKPYRVCPIT